MARLDNSKRYANSENSRAFWVCSSACAITNPTDIQTSVLPFSTKHNGDGLVNYYQAGSNLYGKYCSILSFKTNAKTETKISPSLIKPQPRMHHLPKELRKKYLSPCLGSNDLICPYTLHIHVMLLQTHCQ